MKLLLIDANSLIHRAFHALPPLTSPNGSPAGALYGLSMMLLKVLAQHKPEYVAAAFDRPEPTFRKKEFDAYKAHRPKTPDELIEQLKEAHALFSAFGISSFEKPGFEADDIIGTMAKKFGYKNGVRVVILTGDMDTLQLVEDPFIEVETPKKGVSETVLYDEKGVKNRYGIPPKLLTDYKGLVGDTSDNIPGVRGIGPKTAERLLNKYGSLENVLELLPEGDLSYKKIIGSKKEAILSKKLGTVKCDVPFSTSLDKLSFSYMQNKNVLADYFRVFGFESLLRRIGEGSSEIKEKKDNPNEKVFPAYKIVEDKESVSKKTNKDFLLVAYDWKTIMKQTETDVEGKIFDISIASWLLDPDQKDISFSSLSLRFLKEFYKNGVPKEKNKVIEALFKVLYSKLKEYKLENVFYDVEMPLIPVLAAMELQGISIHKKTLSELRIKIQKETEVISKEIFTEVGEEFNISSPKQVGEMLFEKLNIRKKGKKTKTGAHSTAENILSELKEKNPIVRRILEYRENTKVVSTYIDPLLELTEKNNKIHTTFLQTGTATGRISSEQPNLQNIPQESKWALPLRKAFVATEGFKLVSFDYSQLELRLLAHISGDEELKKTFIRGDDVHAITASRILNIPESSVTKEARRMGKILNFGIVYGMGPRAFAKTSNITLDEARRFINEYFRRFPGVKKWRETTATNTKTLGYVEDEVGRRRWFSNANKWGPRAVAEMERAAINMPVQGLEADILKITMAKSRSLLGKRGLFPKKASMILTIHDELIFEIADDILEETSREIKKIAEEGYPISVPLVVEIKTGRNLGEMEEFKP